MIAIAITYLLGALLGYSASDDLRTVRTDAHHRIVAAERKPIAGITDTAQEFE